MKKLLLLLPLLVLLIPKPEPKTVTQSVLFDLHQTYLPLISKTQPQIKFGYGIDWREPHYTTEKNLSLNATWFHNWGIWPDMQSEIEFVQHLYCNDEYYFDQLAKLNGGYVLFLNEPDLWDQCNITPEQAVDALIRARKTCPQCKFVGAQVLLINDWLLRFMQALERRGVEPPELGAFHIYASSPQIAQNKLDEYFSIIDQFYVPESVWITELGGENPATVTKLTEICHDSRIGRCAYFSPKCDPNFNWWWVNQKYCLMDMGGNLNERGLVWYEGTIE